MRPSLLCALSASLALAQGCAQSVGSEIPLDTFYYPAHVTSDPAGRGLVYVVNADFDLRYSGGSVLALDLTRVSPSAAPQAAGPVVAGAARVPAFGGQLALAPDGLRGLLPIRGDAAALPLTFSDGLPRCADAATACEEAAQRYTPADFSLALDPYYFTDFYAAAWVPADAGSDGYPHERVVIGTLGWRTALPLAWPAGDALPRPLPALAPQPGGLADLLWAPDRGQLFGAGQRTSKGSDGAPGMVLSISLPVAEASAPSSRNLSLFAQFGGADVNALAYRSGGLLLAAISGPNALVGVDLEQIATDRPQGMVVAVAPLEGEPGDLALLERPGGDLAFVSCLTCDAVLVIDLRTWRLAARLLTDPGPFVLALRPAPGGGTWLVVTEFYAHGVALYDVSAAAPADFSLVARLNDGQHDVSVRAF